MATAAKEVKEKKPSTMDRPNREDLDKKTKSLRDKIEEHKGKLEDLYRKDRESRQNKEGSSESQSLRKQSEELGKQISSRRGEFDALRTKIKDIDVRKRELRSKLQENPRGDFKSVEEVEKEIRKLEFELETGGGGSLKHERRIMQQIRDLEHSKRNVRDRDEVQDEFEILDTQRKSYVEQVEELQKELDSLRTEKTAITGQLDALREQKEQGKEKGGNKEIDNLKAQIDKLYDEIRTARADFDKRMDEWMAWRKAEQERQRERREAETKRRQEEREARAQENARRAQEKKLKDREFERVKRQNPHEDEINICESLIDFLGKNSAKKETPVQRRTTENPEAYAKPPTGFTYLKKDNDEDWLYGDRSKKKAAQAAAKKTETEKADRVAKDQPLHLPLFRVQQFQTLGLKAPRLQSETTELIAQLKEKKAHFLTFKRSAAEVDAELEAEEQKREEEARKRHEEEKKNEAAQSSGTSEEAGL